MARQVLDSRGIPTVEVEVLLEGGTYGRCAAPSGASTGKHEAVEVRDGDENRFHGNSVESVVRTIEEEIAPQLRGKMAADQNEIDQTLIELDGTRNKSNLGANATVAISIATARAMADFIGLPLFRYVGGTVGNQIPVPLLNILNGGVHASNPLVIQEFMIVPVGFDQFDEAIRAGSEIFTELGRAFRERGKSTALGDEGGYATRLETHTQALKSLVTAIEDAGYQPGNEVAIALDAAANEFYDSGRYDLSDTGEGKLDSIRLVDLYENWVDNYPIISIEDGLAEVDDEGWEEITDRLADDIQIVGDDLFVTNPEFIRSGIEHGLANAVLIKPNQIGTLTETCQAIDVARSGGYTPVISHRSGETEDTSIADFAVGLNCPQIKAGSVARGERVAKYNRLSRIINRLEGSTTEYAGKNAFSSPDQS